MILIPAIDIKEGKVVRLIQGKFDKVTVYSSDPVKMAQFWEYLGAKWLHVVDLDGAQTGKMKNTDIILNIKDSVKIPVQVGGGLSDENIIDQLLKAGIARAVVGTKVIEDRKFLKKALKIWDKKIAVSVDCSNGFLTKHGWTETSKIQALDFVADLENLGVKCVIYTDIARDGMLRGPNFDGLKSILETVKISVIASGGIGSMDDIQKLIAMGEEHKNLIGAITGKAIYEETVDFKEAAKLCSQRG